MKSNHPVLTILAVQAILLAVIVQQVRPIYLSGAATVQELRDPGHRSLIMSVYKAFHCFNKRCPNWRCEDDSAIIHGYCCGCPNWIGAHVPVLCVNDLKCPLNPKTLCDDYNFMVTCCCSRK